MKNLLKNLMYFIIVLMFLGLVVGGDSSSRNSNKQNYEQELKRAVEKDVMGAPLTRGEDRRLKSYRKWEKEHNTKEYNKKYY